MNFPISSGGDCARAWETMPWALQDGSSPERRAWLAEHLSHCEACSAEFAQQRRLKRALSLPVDIPVDAEAGLQRLLDRVDMEPLGESAAVRTGSGKWLTRALAAAVLLQALGIGALGLRWWSEQSPQYRTLSQPALSAAPGAIRVVPASGMKVADWDKLLRNLKLKVVSGPNDVGAYMVVPADNDDTPRHALQQLRSSRGILLAEPVDNAQ